MENINNNRKEQLEKLLEQFPLLKQKQIYHWIFANIITIFIFVIWFFKINPSIEKDENIFTVT